MKLKNIIFFVITISNSLYTFSPLFKAFPHPPGPYSIGTSSMMIVDSMRKEIYAKNTRSRRLMARLWYPVTPIKGQRYYPYLGDAMPAFQELVADYYRIPCWLSKFLFRGLTTHAYQDVPCKATMGGWPVVLFSHGLLGMPSETYTTILEAIASAGYVVVGIEHPYFNILTCYPDGTTASSVKLSEQFAKMRPEQQREFQRRAIETYKTDMACVLRELAVLAKDSTSPWHHTLDLSRVVVMGHSAGGTAAIEFCRTHSECKGAIDLDGWYDHCIEHKPLDQPLLLLFASNSLQITEPTLTYLARKELTREQYYEREAAIINHKILLSQSPLCSMIVLAGNVSHDDFHDFILMRWPLRPWKQANGYETLKIINTSLLQFLDQTLKSTDKE